MDRLRKLYSYLAGGSLLAGKAGWVLSGCLTTESGDHCVLVNVRAWLKLGGDLVQFRGQKYADTCMYTLKVEV